MKAREENKDEAKVKVENEVEVEVKAKVEVETKVEDRIEKKLIDSVLISYQVHKIFGSLLSRKLFLRVNQLFCRPCLPI